MMLMDIPREKVKKNGNGIKVTTLSVGGECGLECDKRSFVYVIILWLVSLLAMISNIAKALAIKARKHKALKQILWQMGRDPKHYSSFAVDRFSRFNHQAKSGAAGWRALDLFYNFYSKIAPQLNGGLESWMTRYWIQRMENRQAVTNRLKVVIKMLENAFSKLKDEPEIRLVSVASGSAQAVVQAMMNSPHKNVMALLLDIDESAIAEAKALVAKNGLTKKFIFVHGTVKKLEDVCRNFRPHVIEMVGFLDYRPEKKAIELVARIKRCLPKKGIFITCNIMKNRERPFLDWVLLWPMIYRSENELARILSQGGFRPGKTEILYEPFRIHGIAVCRA
jgi:hypothetical protein